MNYIKQIFLDLDGPLLDGKDRHYYCYRDILKRYGFIPIGIDEYWESKRALTNRKDLLALSGAEVIYFDFLTEWLRLIETPEALALDKVQQGAVECLRSWKAVGIDLILVTMRKNKQALEEQLILTGLRQFLNVVLACDHAVGSVGKADAVRNHFLRKVNLAEALWIGDTEVDWHAAKVVECEVVLLSNGLRNEAYLKSLQGAVVKPSIASLKDYVLGVSDVS